MCDIYKMIRRDDRTIRSRAYTGGYFVETLIANEPRPLVKIHFSDERKERKDQEGSWPCNAASKC